MIIRGFVTRLMSYIFKSRSHLPKWPLYSQQGGAGGQLPDQGQEGGWRGGKSQVDQEIKPSGSHKVLAWLPGEQTNSMTWFDNVWQVVYCLCCLDPRSCPGLPAPSASGAWAALQWGDLFFNTPGELGCIFIIWARKIVSVYKVPL